MIIIGDFNLHFENSNDIYVKNFKTLIGEHGLDQAINGPTHIKGHTLDLILIRSDVHGEPIANINISDMGLSDHFVISFQLFSGKLPAQKKCVTSRNIKSIDIETFKESLNFSLAHHNPETVQNFDKCLKDVLDKAAPLEMKFYNPSRRAAPWMNQRIKTSKQAKRKAERKWTKSKLEVHKGIYITTKKVHVDILREEKGGYYNNEITESKSSKDLFKIYDDLTGGDVSKPLPNICPPKELPTVFNTFFVQKIEQIREELDASPSEPEFDDFIGITPLSHFQHVSEEFVKSIILKAPKNIVNLIHSNYFMNVLMSCYHILHI